MDNTYYLIKKHYKGLFTKKHVGNESRIITTITKTNEGMILIPIGKERRSGKPVFWSPGFHSENGDEISEALSGDSNSMILEKIPSTAVEIINNKIDYISVEKWESPIKVNISLKNTGKYLRSKTIKLLLIDQLKDRTYIYLGDMILKEELSDLDKDQVKMAAYKASAMFKARENIVAAKTSNLDLDTSNEFDEEE